MPTIRIRDLEDGHLAFDLAELLQVLGERAVFSTWKCAVEECLAREGARPDLEDMYKRERLSGARLFELASETRQVIDGWFEACLRGRKQSWIKLEAVDSTY